MVSRVKTQARKWVKVGPKYVPADAAHYNAGDIDTEGTPGSTKGEEGNQTRHGKHGEPQPPAAQGG